MKSNNSISSGSSACYSPTIAGMETDEMNKQDLKGEISSFFCGSTDSDSNVMFLDIANEEVDAMNKQGLNNCDSVKLLKGNRNQDAEWLGSMFTVLDKDSDGRVSVDEIMKFWERLNLNMPKEEVESMVRSASACGHDFLTASEFAKFYKLISGKDEKADDDNADEHEICEAFRVFDEDGDGFISAVELAKVLCRLGLAQGRDVQSCQRMIEGVDSNGDGFVDIHEFKHLITKGSSNK